MQFNFDLSKILKLDNNGYAVLTRQTLNQGKTPQQQNSFFYQNSQQNLLNTPQQQLKHMINTMGELSRRAQGLGQIVTTYEKLANNDDTLFVKIDNKNNVLGILRIGKKNLFYSDRTGKMINIQPMCLLDFYIHESCQRTGLGKELFEYMLEYVQTGPNKLAYDKPSLKLKPFLKKHYGLSTYIPQNNNFVIYNAYFDKHYEYKRPEKKQESVDEKQFKQNQSYNYVEPKQQQQQHQLQQSNMNKTNSGHSQSQSQNINQYSSNSSQYGTNNNKFQNQSQYSDLQNQNMQNYSSYNNKKQNYHYSGQNSQQISPQYFEHSQQGQQVRQQSIKQQEEELLKLQREIDGVKENKQNKINSVDYYNQYKQQNHGIFGHYNYGKTFQPSSRQYGQGSDYRF